MTLNKNLSRGGRRWRICRRFFRISDRFRDHGVTFGFLCWVGIFRWSRFQIVERRIYRSVTECGIVRDSPFDIIGLGAFVYLRALEESSLASVRCLWPLHERLVGFVPKNDDSNNKP